MRSNSFYFPEIRVINCTIEWSYPQFYLAPLKNSVFCNPKISLQPEDTQVFLPGVGQKTHLPLLTLLVGKRQAIKNCGKSLFLVVEVF